MNDRHAERVIVVLQVGSVAMIWVFVVAIAVWIIHLLRLSHRLHDVPSASVAIAIVAIPVFFVGAAVLTYVFVGLRRGRAEEAPAGAGEEPT